MTDWEVKTAPFRQDHPCLAGHFPGNPIIPGTLILDRVIDTLTQKYPNLVVSEVVSAKFLHPLKPGKHFTIVYREKPGEMLFECRTGDTPLSSGRLKLSPSGEPL